MAECRCLHRQSQAAAASDIFIKQEREGKIYALKIKKLAICNKQLAKFPAVICLLTVANCLLPTAFFFFLPVKLRMLGKPEHKFKKVACA